MVSEEYEVVWTPSFTDDVYLAVDYIQNYLKMPIAAQNLFNGVIEALDNQRSMPTSATTKTSPQGRSYYIVSYRRYNIYYQIEGRKIKAVALKHQLQQ